MKKSMKVEIIKRLVARGEVLCARFMCYDWNLDFEKVVGNESKERR